MNAKDQVLQLIASDKSEEDYFFQKLATASKPLEWLKTLYDKHYFDGSKNPVLQAQPENPNQFIVPYWNVLGFLANVAKHNEVEKDPSITEMLLNIVHDIHNYRQPNGERINNYQTNVHIIKILSSIPANSLPHDLFGYLAEFMNDRWATTPIGFVVTQQLIPHLILERAKDHLLYVVDLLYSPRSEDGKSGSDFTMEDYYLNKISDEYHAKLYEICGVSIIQSLINIIVKIVSLDRMEFSVFTVPSVEESDQSRDFHEYQITIIRFIRKLLEYAPPIDTYSIVNSMLDREVSILKRLAIHTVNHHFKSFESLFWEKGGQLFAKYQSQWLRHEFYLLLRKHASEFSTAQFDMIFSWIENQQYGQFSQEEDSAQRSVKIAYHKAEWYTALLPSRQAESRLESLYAIHGSKIEHPEFDTYVSELRGEYSPISQEELSTKSPDDLITFINAFEEKGEFGGPTKHALSRVLTNVVTAHPDNFIGELDKFLLVDRQFQYALLEGFLQRDAKLGSLEWVAILDFCKKVIHSMGFWEEEYKDGWNFRDWILGSISGIIKKAVQDSEFPQADEVRLRGEYLLSQTLAHIQPGKPWQGDALTYTLNTTYGKTITAVLALICSSLNPKNQTVREWPASMRNIIEEGLSNPAIQSPEFSSALGQYFKFLFFWDTAWAKQNAHRIFPKDLPDHWCAAFSSYLFYNNTVYAELYGFLKTTGDYSHGLDYEFEDRHNPHEKVIVDIAVAYYGDLEDLRGYDSLISRIINNEENLPLLIEHLSRFSWLTEEEHYVLKTKLLWAEILSTIEKMQYPTTSTLMSELIGWMKIVPVIDGEVLQLLMKSAPYVKNDNSSYFILKAIKKHLPLSPELTARFYLSLTNHGFRPPYQDEEVIALVEQLITLGQDSTAKLICEKYRQDSIFFLKPTYEKHWPTKII